MPASFLVKGGMSVRLYNGIPTGSVFAEKEQAFVIALKSRTEKTELAVKESLEAARFLRHSGIKQMYFKYCSTFDPHQRGILDLWQCINETHTVKIHIIMPVSAGQWKNS